MFYCAKNYSYKSIQEYQYPNEKVNKEYELEIHQVENKNEQKK